MKKIVLFALGLIGIFQANAQLKLVDDHYEFQKITTIQLTQAEIVDKTSQWIALQFNEEMDKSLNTIELKVERNINISGELTTVSFDYCVAFGPGWYQERATNFTILDGQEEFNLSHTGRERRKLVVSSTSFELNMLSNSLLSNLFTELHASRKL